MLPELIIHTKRKLFEVGSKGASVIVQEGSKGASEIFPEGE